MKYNIKPIRTYEDYTKTAERETVAAAYLLLDTISENDGEEIDSEGVIYNSLDKWLNNKEVLADSPLFNGLSKFELNITEINSSKEHIVDAVDKFLKNKVGRKHYLHDYPHEHITDFHDVDNYERLLKEQPLVLRPKTISYQKPEYGYQYDEEDFLVRHVTNQTGSNLKFLMAYSLKLAQAEEKIRYIINPGVTLGVYKFLYDIGLLKDDLKIDYNLNSISASLISRFSMPNRVSMSKTMESMETVEITQQNMEDLLPIDLFLTGGSISPFTNEDGEVMYLLYTAPYVRCLKDESERIFVKKYPMEEADFNQANFVYATLVNALYDVLHSLDVTKAEELCQPLLDELNEPLRLKERVMSLTDFNEFEEVVLQNARYYYSDNVPGVGRIAIDLISILLFQPLITLSTKSLIGSDVIPEEIITEIDDTLAKRLNQCGTLNKQLQMLEREITNLQCKFLRNHGYKNRRDVVIMPNRYRANAKHAVDTVTSTSSWHAAEEKIVGYYDNIFDTIVAISKKKSTKNDFAYLEDTVDSLKINNSTKYIVPKEDTWIVSLEPKDILTASVNANNWHSCHTSGYGNTPVMLAANHVTFIIYQKSSKDMDSDGVSIDNKKVRAYGHYSWSQSGASLVIEQSYPYNCRIIEKVLPRVLGEIGRIHGTEVNSIRYDMNDYNCGDHIVTGYLDLFETRNSRAIGDYELDPGDIVAYPAPNFGDGEYNFDDYDYLAYGEVGCLDMYYHA